MKLVYAFLKVTFALALRVYYRRVYINHEENIPSDGPVIFGCNHPNSFLDACALGALTRRPLYFLARSDVFNTPFKKWLLWQMHMLPIYRLEEGSGNLGKNRETFEIGKKLFSKNRMLLIFSEGVCVQEKRLRKLRKGTARLAFDAEHENDFNLGLKVVPVALNYTYPALFRKELIITYGRPISMADYSKVYRENQARAMNDFNAELYKRLEENIIVIRQKESEPLAEQLLETARNEWPRPKRGWLIYNKLLRLRNEQAVTDKVNAWYEKHREKHDKLAETAALYSKMLADHDLSDRTIKRQGRTKAMKWFWFLLMSPFAAIGYLGNIIPVLLADLVARKKVKMVEFFSSVRLGSGYLFFILYYILLVLLAVLSGQIWLYFIPLLGIAAIWQHDSWKGIRQGLNYNYLSESRKKELKKLRHILVEAISS